MNDSEAMALALAQARQAPSVGDVPIGAVILDESGAVVAAAHNRREIDGDPTAHAEILALRQAGMERARWHLGGCTLVVTLEPCTMCAGALVLARIDRVVFGASDPKAGACGSVTNVLSDPRLNHQPRVRAGVEATAAGQLLKDFFAARRSSG
ncbi:MAG: tRNA adenosine(34) deaminase TadA [Beutenbergiaceae bacterium]